MQKILNTIAFVFIVVFANAQDFDSVFEKFEDSDDYTIITINKEMFRMIASFDADLDDKGIRDLVRNIKTVKIYHNEDSGSAEDFKELKKIALGTSMNNLISVKSADERVELFTNPTGDEAVVDGLVLLVHEGDQNVFIRMEGLIDLDALARLAEKIDIDGFDELKKLGKKGKRGK